MPILYIYTWYEWLNYPPQEIRGQNQAVNEYPEYEFMLYCPKKVNKHSGIDRNCRLRMFFFILKQMLQMSGQEIVLDTTQNVIWTSGIYFNSTIIN